MYQNQRKTMNKCAGSTLSIAYEQMSKEIEQAKMFLLARWSETG